jgi:acetyl esterase/lipase
MDPDRVAIGDCLLEFCVVPAETLAETALPVPTALHPHEPIRRRQYEKDRIKNVVNEPQDAHLSCPPCKSWHVSRPPQSIFAAHMTNRGAGVLTCELRRRPRHPFPANPIANNRFSMLNFQ